MRLHTLPGTDVTTSPLGLGCAGLYRLPHRDDRAAVLRAALAAGIRHFDAAPMYGLGRAESELAPYLQAQRGEITVTTKFGIDVSAIGRTIGRVQGPVRAVLARRPDLQRQAGESGSGPSSGSLGRLLYTAAGYDVATAARSLHNSLRTLRTDYIDVFALHDPMGAVITDGPELAGYLNEQVRAGTIRSWGVAGELPPPGADAARLVDDANVVQHHDDVFADPVSVAGHRLGGRHAVITFGCLSHALPTLLRHLATPGATARWSERFGAQLDVETVAALLLREATRRNSDGVVLFSTTRPERVGAAVDAVTEAAAATEAATLHELVREVARDLPTLGAR